MTSADLLARRTAIVEEHKKLEKTRDSGWHPADLGALAREQKKELPLSDRVVALQDDDRVKVCGPDVARVVDAVKTWLPKGEALLSAAGGQRKDVEHAVKCCKKLVAAPVAEVLDFFTQEWNGICLALQPIGSHTDADYHPGLQVTLSSVTA